MNFTGAITDIAAAGFGNSGVVTVEAHNGGDGMGALNFCVLFDKDQQSWMLDGVRIVKGSPVNIAVTPVQVV